MASILKITLCNMAAGAPVTSAFQAVGGRSGKECIMGVPCMHLLIITGKHLVTGLPGHGVGNVGFHSKRQF